MAVYKLSWMADVLRAAGIKVEEQPGWQGRGRSEFGTAAGVMLHHTAGPLKGNMPSLNTCINGRPDLKGPLCHLCLGRDGTYYVVGAGRANHAGKGVWKGRTDGNSQFIGIEAENTGLPNDPWPAVQMEAYRKGVSALLRHLGLKAGDCCGHKEYALPKGRKPDPSFDMDTFRKSLVI